MAKCGHAGCNAGMVILSGKGGQYRYYVCNNKATAGADICRNKSIREEALASIVLDRSEDAKQGRKRNLDRVRRERIAEETWLWRLLEIVEEGLKSVRDPILAPKLAEANGSIAALSDTERSLAGQLGST